MVVFYISQQKSLTTLSTKGPNTSSSTLPPSTALGALLSHITGDAAADTFQPMNVNFGLFPPLHEVKKKQRKEAYTERAKADFGSWLATMDRIAA